MYKRFKAVERLMYKFGELLKGDNIFIKQSSDVIRNLAAFNGVVCNDKMYTISFEENNKKNYILLSTYSSIDESIKEYFDALNEYNLVYYYYCGDEYDIYSILIDEKTPEFETEKIMNTLYFILYNLNMYVVYEKDIMNPYFMYTAITSAYVFDGEVREEFFKVAKGKYNDDGRKDLTDDEFLELIESYKLVSSENDMACFRFLNPKLVMKMNYNERNAYKNIHKDIEEENNEE